VRSARSTMVSFVDAQSLHRTSDAERRDSVEQKCHRIRAEFLPVPDPVQAGPVSAISAATTSAAV